MLDKIKNLLKGEVSLTVDRHGKPSSREAHIATAVLLLEMAGKDEDYAPEEVKSIFNTLGLAFGISEDDALDFLESVDSVRQQHQKIDGFVATLNDVFDARQKQLIYAMIWKIVAADGKVTKDERVYATQLRQRLQLSEQQAEQAKELIAQGKI